VIIITGIPVSTPTSPGAPTMDLFVIKTWLEAKFDRPDEAGASLSSTASCSPSSPSWRSSP
jgi:hypothetical protein